VENITAHYEGTVCLWKKGGVCKTPNFPHLLIYYPFIAISVLLPLMDTNTLGINANQKHTQKCQEKDLAICRGHHEFILLKNWG
jgi:hypothetical protein